MRRKVLYRDGLVVLYELVNGSGASRKACLGYQLALTNQSGKITQGWKYEASELRWARAGFAALVDAQSRSVLGDRSKWKPYSADSWSTVSPTIESFRVPDAGDGQGQRFAPAGYSEVAA